MHSVAKTLEQSIVSASDTLPQIPQDTIVSFSSSEFFCDTIFTEYIRHDPASILSMKELDTMIKRLESSSYQRVHDKYTKRTGKRHDDLRLISSSIVSISIDGKKILNPIGFTGGKVSMRVLNVFAPASEFNIIRSIVSNVSKRIISLVPTPLLFQKIIEQSEYSDETICTIDIGYNYTSVVVSSENEIQIFESFPIGTKLLMEMIYEDKGDTTFVHIENILCSESSMQSQDIAAIVDEFIEYILDMIEAFLTQEKITLRFKYLFVHGSIYLNPYFFKKFSKRFEDMLGYPLIKDRITELIPKNERKSEAITYALGLTASELLLVKKDPLVRVLRYVLYNYE